MYEIKLKIHEESDLYNPLDPDGILLADDVVSYIIRNYEERPDIREKHTIHIYSDTPVDEERARRNIRKYSSKSTITDYFYTSMMSKGDVDAWLKGIKE